ncbi:MAG: peptidase, partial [Gammaproteobacteria bacterium]
WFSGYAAGVVTTAWVGFDKPRSLGKRETGARAALPIWIEYMEQALAGLPEQPLKQPADVVSARIRADTGQLAGADEEQAIFEYFKVSDLEKLRSIETYQPEGESDRAEIF